MQSIAFLTSGGDAPGMNAVVRAIARYALHAGLVPYAIYDGFKGLLADDMHEFTWDSVSHILQQGGTMIRSSRCPEFHEKAKRRTAAYNLIKRNVACLIVVGGDGSLTGASLLFEEWKGHLMDLCAEGLVESSEMHGNFGVIGIPGSIDNDICETESTLGADTALLRATEAIDCISSTAYSHSRTFIIEIMGRHCGWLALNAFVACDADYVFLPEQGRQDTWKTTLHSTISQVNSNQQYSEDTSWEA